MEQLSGVEEVKVDFEAKTATVIFDPALATVPYLTSTAALELNALPRSIMILGGGYIGCELAQMFARAGSKMTLVTRSRLLPETEPEIAGALTGFFEDEGINIRTNLAYREIKKSGDGVALHIEHDGYLTMVEGLKLAAQSFGKDVTKLPCCAG